MTARSKNKVESRMKITKNRCAGKHFLLASDMMMMMSECVGKASYKKT